MGFGNGRVGIMLIDVGGLPVIEWWHGRSALILYVFAFLFTIGKS